MAKKLIPAQVLMQCMNLSKEQVAAAMEHGGATVSLTSVQFLGMMPGGAFVYKCEGTSFRKVFTSKEPGDVTYTLENEEWPDYFSEFKIKVVQEKNHAGNFKPEFQARAKARMLNNDFIVAWA